MLLSSPKDPKNSPHRRVRWIFGNHKFTIATTFVAFLGLIPIGFLYLSFESWVLLSTLAVLSFAYGIPFLKFNQKKIGLRNIPGIKLFLISLVWAVSCVLLPIVELEAKNTISIPLGEILILVLKRFLFICAITIPFDIRDFYDDKLSELKTIPVMFGEKKAWIFCQIMLAMYFILLLLFTKAFNLDVFALLTTLLLTGWLIFKSNYKRNEYFYFLYLDGTMLLQFLFLFGFEWMAGHL
jgi:4-hydroxybenzoate polyprenyltransferase